jgi:hypothetical protein
MANRGKTASLTTSVDTPVLTSDAPDIFLFAMLSLVLDLLISLRARELGLGEDDRQDPSMHDHGFVFEKQLELLDDKWATDASVHWLNLKPSFFAKDLDNNDWETLVELLLEMITARLSQYEIDISEPRDDDIPDFWRAEGLSRKAKARVDYPYYNLSLEWRLSLLHAKLSWHVHKASFRDDLKYYTYDKEYLSIVERITTMAEPALKAFLLLSKQASLAFNIYDKSVELPLGWASSEEHCRSLLEIWESQLKALFEEKIFGPKIMNIFRDFPPEMESLWVELFAIRPLDEDDESFEEH